MQPYVNPNYLNQYQPNNYLNPYSNYGLQNNNPYLSNQYQPQAQVPVQAQSIIGRVVNSFDDIVANDVPMDGRSAVFPKNDLSEIQIRQWSADGKIQVTTYKPILEQNGVQTENLSNNTQNVKIDLSDASTEVFMKRFDDITYRLDMMEQFLSKPTTSRRKKEVEVDE